MAQRETPKHSNEQPSIDKNEANLRQADSDYFDDFESRLHYAASEGTPLPVLPDYEKMSARYHQKSTAHAAFHSRYEYLDAKWSDAYYKQSVEFYGGPPLLTLSGMEAPLSEPDPIPVVPSAAQPNPDADQFLELSLDGEEYLLSDEELDEYEAEVSCDEGEYFISTEELDEYLADE